ncbi:hypothetical protein A2783_01580 [Microgenomates group bacterium RIFCSPHIGHO2_01_FULL_45_11]|nr:MAG: hypothetical protein A2783_01580 [Microgenomates group bacterium RIFCSPHIGHO2_01_FULL_45_11]
MFINVIIPSTLNKTIKPHVTRCIHSLLKSSRSAKIKIRIFVVTTKNKTSPQLSVKNVDTVIQAPNQAGFAEMNNKAIKQTIHSYPANYYLLINDDAWIATTFFKEFKKISGSPDFIIPLVCKKNKKQIDSFGGEYFNSGYAKKSTGLKNPTTVAPASCLLIKTEFLKRLKKIYGYIFNPILHYYHEDVDLSIRACAVGTKMLKVKSMIAFHMGSTTSGKKSYFVMYHSYRNIIWVMIMNWPIKTLIRNLSNIILVQTWAILYSCIKYGPVLYLGIFLDTYKHSSELVTYRRKNLGSFPQGFEFYSVLSKYAFRTRQGWKIKFF